MMNEEEFPTIGILQQRKIEAEIIKPIYEIMKRKFGMDEAKAVIEEAVSQAAIRAGQEFAKEEPNGTSIKSFVALQYLWEKDDALDTEVTVNTDQQFDYTVKRCSYAQMYHKMGLGEIGYLLSCNRDAKFIEGYAPHIKLTRPHTIMNGDGFCDFSYKHTSKVGKNQT